MRYIYLIFNDDNELMRKTTSKLEANYWCKNRPDWTIVKKSVPLVKFEYEEAPF